MTSYVCFTHTPRQSVNQSNWHYWHSISYLDLLQNLNRKHFKKEFRFMITCVTVWKSHWSWFSLFSMQWVLLHLYPFDNAMGPLTSISISQCNGPSYIWLYLSLFHGSHTHPVNKMFVFFITVKMFSSSSFFFCHHLQLNGLVGNIVKKVIDQKFSWMNYCKISLHQLPQCSKRDSAKALQHQKICP